MVAKNAKVGTRIFAKYLEHPGPPKIEVPQRDPGNLGRKRRGLVAGDEVRDFTDARAIEIELRFPKSRTTALPDPSIKLIEISSRRIRSPLAPNGNTDPSQR